jgi:hypothetical protein
MLGTVVGEVGAQGNIFKPTNNPGFAVGHTPPGNYRVRFTVPFSVPPVVVVSRTAPDPPTLIQVSASSPTDFVVDVFVPDSPHDRIDGGFSFVAIG